MPERVRSGLLRTLISAAFIAALLFLCLHLPHVKDTTVALLLVLAVVGIAARWGWLESLVAALLAGLGFDYYFLPPRGLILETPEDWGALAAFLITAITASWLFARALRWRTEAAQQRDEMEKLYRLVNTLLDSGGAESAIAHLADHVLEIFGADGVALYDKHRGQVFRSGPRAGVIPDHALHESTVRGYGLKDNGSSFFIATIRHADETFGSLGISGAALSPSLLDAITGRIGMGLAKFYADEKIRKAEVARRSQELKSAVLDALAHEIKNPLNSIKIAVTTLLSGYAGDEPARQELLGIIDEEVDRVNTCIDETVQMARVEADELILNKQPLDVALLIPEAIHEIATLPSHRSIDVCIPESLPPAECDKVMIAHVLKQLLGNALKYSPEDSPLTVSAEFTGTAIVMNVIDHGPGVPEAERERIFEKYYRGHAAGSGLPGTGLGLASAKCIVQAHGGEIWVTSSPGGGAAFHVSLPVAQEVR